MPEDNDYGCPVCGKHFDDEDDYKNHGERDHPEFNEMYAKEQEDDLVIDNDEDLYALHQGIMDKAEVPDRYKEESDEQEDEYSDDLGDFTDNPKQGKYDDRPVVQGEPVDIVGEIDQQEDKPIQSHDEWKEELEGLKDEFATEQEKCAICNSEDHSTNEHPVISDEGGQGSGPTGKPSLLPEQVARADDPNYNPFRAEPRPMRDPSTLRTTEDAPDESEDNLVWDDKTNHYVNKSEEDVDPVKCEDCGADFDSQYVLDKHADIEHGTEEGGADAPLKKVDDLTESWKYMKREDKARLFETIGMTQGDAYALANLEWNYISKPLKKDVIRAYATEQDVPDEEYEQEQREEAKAQDEEDEVYENFYNLEKNHSSPDSKKKKLICNQCNESFKHINEYHIHYNEIHATEQEYTLPEECPYCHIEINEPDTLDWHMEKEHGAHVPSQFTQTGLQGAMTDTDFDSLESHKATEAKWECLDCDQEFDDAGKHLEDTGHHNIVRSHTESYAKEARLDSEGYPICQICGETITGDEDVLFDLTNNVTQHLLSHGKTEGEVAEIQHKMLMGGAMESRVSDLKRERKELANFINIASIENPLNIYNEQEKLREIDAELASLGEAEMPEWFQDPEQREEAEKANAERVKQMQKTEEGELGMTTSDDDYIDINEPFGSTRPREQRANEEDVLVDDSGSELDWFNKYGTSYTDGNQTIIDTNDPKKLDSVLKREGMHWNADKGAYDWGEAYAKEADDDERKCEGCGRMEDYLNDDDLCEDCEREAGIDRKESERDAYD